MAIKKKLSLQTLKVQSFVTSLDTNTKRTVKGGRSLQVGDCFAESPWKPITFYSHCNSDCNNCPPYVEPLDDFYDPDVPIPIKTQGVACHSVPPGC